MEIGNPAIIRKLNRDAVLNHLRKAGSCSRAGLAKILGLAPATVSAVVSELISDQLIIETGPSQTPQRSPGRPSTQIRLNPDAGYVIGIVLDTSESKLSLTALWSNYAGGSGPILNYPVEGDLSLDHITKSIGHVVKTLHESLPSNPVVMATAIGVPGVVVGNDILHAPRLHSLLGSEFHGEISRLLGMPVFLENDVNLALYSMTDTQPRLHGINYGYLLISGGVGSGVSLANSVWKSNNWSGEVGHIKVPLDGKDLTKLESIIGLDGIYIERLKSMGVTFSGDTFNGEVLHLNQAAQALVRNYLGYLLIAIQSLNAAVGLDELILDSKEMGFLRYIYPLILEEIEQSPLKLVVSLSENSKTSLVQGASILALKNSLQKLQFRKSLNKD